MADLVHKYNYLAFVKDADDGIETVFTVLILDADKRRSVGTIKWYSKCRAFCFYPIGGAVLPARCLKEIVDFISEAMDAYADVMMQEAKA